MLYLPWSLSPKLLDTLKPPHTLMSTMSTYFFSSPTDSLSSYMIQLICHILKGNLSWWLGLDLCSFLFLSPLISCHRSGSTRLASHLLHWPSTLHPWGLIPGTIRVVTLYVKFCCREIGFALNSHNYHFDLHDDHRFLKCYISDLCNFLVLFIFKNFFILYWGIGVLTMFW